MKGLAKYALLVLPALVLLSLIGWVVLGGLPDVTLTGDLVSWLAELPILTCYALATLVAAMCGMHLSGMNIDNADRLALLQRAASGNRDAYRVVVHESVCWFVMLGFAALYLWPAR